MKITSYAKLFTLAVTLAMSGAANAETVNAFVGVEAGSVEVVSGAGQVDGTVVARDCAQCPITAHLTPNTQYWHIDKSIGLDAVVDYSGKPGTLIYEPKTGRALKVVW